MNEKRKARQQERKGLSMFRMHKRSVIIICTVLVLLAAVLSVNSVSLYARNQAYKQQEAELQAQIEEEKARSEEVEAFQEYVKTDEYIKDVAEGKLRLVDPNEIIFKPAQ